MHVCVYTYTHTNTHTSTLKHTHTHVQAFKSVAAVMCGHCHDGGYGVDEAGVHHITYASPLESEESEGAWGTIELHEQEIVSS